jgi:hypothetical protein
VKFINLLKQLHVNIPFIDVLIQMPKYSKYMRDFLTNKRKCEQLQQVGLGKACSSILLKKIPKKKLDPGSFTIPCSIGGVASNHELADLGTSINVMPTSMFKRLGIGEPHSTMMSIQLVERSIKYPKGIAENLLVKVGEFVFPADFVILDMGEDMDVPLILGRPFPATTRALVDMSEGKLTLSVGEKELKFEVGQYNDPLQSIEAIKLSLDDAIKRSKYAGCTASPSGNT